MVNLSITLMPEPCISNDTANGYWSDDVCDHLAAPSAPLAVATQAPAGSGGARASASAAVVGSERRHAHRCARADGEAARAPSGGLLPVARFDHTECDERRRPRTVAEPCAGAAPAVDVGRDGAIGSRELDEQQRE